MLQLIEMEIEGRDNKLKSKRKKAETAEEQKELAAAQMGKRHYAVVF